MTIEEGIFIMFKSFFGLIGIFVLQELASYILNIFFGKAGKKVPSILSSFYNKKAQEFYETIRTNEYKKFEFEYLRMYYGEEFFTRTHRGMIPVFTIKYNSENDKYVDSIKYFDGLADKENVDFSFSVEEHQKYNTNKYYRKYSKIVGKNIKAPDRPGFMLDEIDCNEKGEMIRFRGYIGTYAENVYSNHVLEYELYKLFCMNNKSMIIKDKLFKKSIIRNNMHASLKRENFTDRKLEMMLKSLRRGEGRQSLLSVQMIVLMRKGKDYYISIIQRSKNVALAPGIFQLVPSGGFEILNDSLNGYSKYEIESNYSLGCAIFREYIEEIFGEPEFEGRGKGSVNEALLKDSHICKIEEMLKNGKAQFEFLGSVMGLAGLRHELSFALVIKDEEYSFQKFYGNEESVNRTFVSDVTLSDFEDRSDIWSSLHGPSAAMWTLFKESKIYKEIVEEYYSTAY